MVFPLNEKFPPKDLGDFHLFLGIEVKRFGDSLHLSFQKYIKHLLSKTGMQPSKLVKMPMISDSLISKYDRNPLTNPTKFRSIIGALLYCVIKRPEIVFVINHLCQFFHALTKEIEQLPK